MTYPAGAGPTAGQFHGGPWTPIDQGGSGGAPRYVFPRILPVRATLTQSRMVATIPAPTVGQGRLITRISVSCTAASVVSVYVGGTEPENWVTGTPAGAGDEHDPNSPIPQPYGQAMYVVWTGTGIVAGVIAVARLEYYEVM